LLGVADLEQGARELEDRYGLTALPGGRHPGAGTANMIVPLGSAYLELIAVVDESEVTGGHLGRRVQEAVAAGRTFVSWAIRTDDLEGLQQFLHDEGWQRREIHDGSRKRPDGSMLKWRTLDLGTGALPFAIQWQIPNDEHPGRMEVQHPSGLDTVGDLVLESDAHDERERLHLLLGQDVPFGLRQGPLNGIREVVLTGREGDRRIMEDAASS
jgi:Glyoxalase-like domain